MAPQHETILQLKRGKHTFIITMKQASSLRLGDIKKQLVLMVQALGGISRTEEDSYQDDIDIPIPTFGDDSDSDEDQKLNIGNNSSSNNIIPDADEVVIGKPNDESNPFGNNFTAVGDNEKLQLRDYSVLAFKIGEEDFYVDQPNADD